MTSPNPQAALTDASAQRAVDVTLGKWLGVPASQLAGGRRFLFQVALVATALNVAVSVHDFFSYGGTDFRARIVGARALLRGLDPYSLTTSRDLNPELQDPHQTHVGLSRCTYSPALLLTYVPLAVLPYQVGRATSMVLEWAALLVMLALLARALRSGRLRYRFVVATLLLVAASPFWRLHVERGQYYVFVGLLLAWGVRQLLKKDADPRVAGIAFGLAVALRGTAVVLLLPLWIAGHRRAVVFAGMSAVAVTSLSLALFGVESWNDYFRAMNQWERNRLQTAESDREFPRRQPTTESVDGFRTAVLPSKSGNISLPEIYGQLARRSPSINPKWGRTVVRGSCLTMVVIVTAGFWLAHRRRPCSPRESLLAGLLLVLLCDFFVPIRVGYADVLYCLALALMTPLLGHPGWRPFALLVVGACLLSVIPIAPHRNEYWFAVTAARSAAFLGCGVLLLWELLGGRCQVDS